MTVKSRSARAQMSSNALSKENVGHVDTGQPIMVLFLRRVTAESPKNPAELI